MPSPGVEGAMKSTTNGAELSEICDEKFDFRAAQARFAQQEAEMNVSMQISASAPSTDNAPLDWTSDRAAQQAAEYDKAEAQALVAATANNSTIDEKKKKKKKHTDV
jgi:hypothetical protein